MTGLAESVRQIPLESNLRRSMRHAVAGQAIGIALPLNMWIVTSSTLLGLTMLRMAAVAALFSMSACGHRKTRLNLLMTCQTCGVRVFRLRQVVAERVVPLMTVLTVANCKVWLILIVTNGALRHHRLAKGRMRTMATDARLLFMRFPFLFQQGCWLFVTGNANRSDLARLFLNHMRQMSRMALHTVDLRHVGDVRAMALLTLHQRTMLARMTLAAIEGGMLIRILFIEPLLVIVTGQADRL